MQADLVIWLKHLKKSKEDEEQHGFLYKFPVKDVFTEVTRLAFNVNQFLAKLDKNVLTATDGSTTPNEKAGAIEGYDPEDGSKRTYRDYVLMRDLTQYLILVRQFFTK